MKKNLFSWSLLALTLFTSLQAATGAQVSTNFDVVTEAQILVDPSYSVSDETRARLKRLDQKYCLFRYYNGFKYPSVIVVDEFIHQVKSVMCGSAEISGFALVKKADQLRRLVALRCMVFSPLDGNIKFDQIYKGYRETLLGQLVEDTLDVVSILPAKQYPGNILVDEYLTGMPMQWALRDIVDFRAVRDYMLTKFEENNVTVPAQKPLLVLGFEKGDQSFDQEDVAFLATYFELGDPADQDLVKYFEDRQNKLDKTISVIGGARQVGESFGEMFMRTIEKPTDGFKPPVIALAVLSVLAGFLISELIKEPVKKMGREMLGTAKKEK